MIESWLREQLDAIGRKMETWPEWQKREIEAEIERTPIRKSQASPRGQSRGRRAKKSGAQAPIRASTS